MAESVLHAWESLYGLLPMSLKKAAFGRNSDAASQNMKRCLSLQLLHPSTNSERWNTVLPSHTWRSGGFTRILESSTKVEGGIKSASNSLGRGSATGAYESWDGELARRKLQEISGWRPSTAHWGHFCVAEVLAWLLEFKMTGKKEEIHKLSTNFRGSP